MSLSYQGIVTNGTFHSGSRGTSPLRERPDASRLYVLTHHHKGYKPLAALGASVRHVLLVAGMRLAGKTS